MPTAAGQTMVITCPNCRTRFQLPPSSLGPRGPRRALLQLPATAGSSSPSPRRRGRRPFFPKLQHKQWNPGPVETAPEPAPATPATEPTPLTDGPGRSCRRSAPSPLFVDRRLADAGSRGPPAGGRRGRPQPDRPAFSPRRSRSSRHLGLPVTVPPGPRLQRPRLRPP